MTSLLALWSSVIPSVPLVLVHGYVVVGLVGMLFMLSVGALLLERDRQTDGVSPPHFADEEHRLAA